jgi:hypothetical protein
LQESHRQWRYQVIDSRTGQPLWRLKLTPRFGVPEVTGGQGLVVVTSDEYPEVAD